MCGEGLAITSLSQKTLANITVHEQLFRFGVAYEMLTFVCDLVIIVCLYVILRHYQQDDCLAWNRLQTGRDDSCRVDDPNHV
jgi:hypothetical protein